RDIGGAGTAVAPLVAWCRSQKTCVQPPAVLTSCLRERMFVVVARVSILTDSRLDSLYSAEGFGGEKTMRAKVIRELIDEIRALRGELAEATAKPHRGAIGFGARDR